MIPGLNLSGGEGGLSLDSSSSAESGDQYLSRTFSQNFAGPTVNNTNWKTVAMVAGGVVLGAILLRRFKVF